MSYAVELTNISKSYFKDGKEISAIKDIDLKIEQGKICGIIGYSGAGKSTLIRLLNLLEKPTTGDVVVNGQNLISLNETELRMARRNISMIFQHFNLLWSRTVIDNIAMPLELEGKSKSEARKRAQELVELVGLNGRENQYPSELSGGQKQRVGIARALSTNPKVILADEATSALDPATTDQILDLLQKINREFGITIVLITHEMHVVKQICHQVAVLDKGTIVEEGEVGLIFHRPQAEITKRFLGQVDSDTDEADVLQYVKENYPGGVVYNFRFFVGNITAPIITTMARKYIDATFHIIHVSTIQTQSGLFINMIVQIIASDAVRTQIENELIADNVTLEVL